MTALTFDPHAALAEIRSQERLRAKEANRANLANDREAANSLAPLAHLALSPAQDPKWLEPPEAQGGAAAWQAALAWVNVCLPPHGACPARWFQIVEDARWLAHRHGDAAAALGWTAGDLFGLDRALAGWGGLADRMNGARKVVFTDSLARWQSDDLEGWLWRRTLRPMPTIWEVHTG